MVGEIPIRGTLVEMRSSGPNTNRVYPSKYRHASTQSNIQHPSKLFKGAMSPTAFNLQEELQHLSDPANYVISNEIDATDDDAIANALERKSHTRVVDMTI